MNDQQLDVGVKDFDLTAVNRLMSHFEIKTIRSLADRSGCNYISLTLMVSGKRKLSSEVRKVLYWYFTCEHLKALLYISNHYEKRVQ